jgi:hypothetical protein
LVLLECFLSILHAENRTGTQNQDVLDPVSAPVIDPKNPLERALARLGTLLAAPDGIEQGAGG